LFDCFANDPCQRLGVARREMRPVSPGRMISGIPPTSLPTTGGFRGHRLEAQSAAPLRGPLRESPEPQSAQHLRDVFAMSQQRNHLLKLHLVDF